MRKILFLLPICCLSIFAFGQRDTLIIHEKGDFKILENQIFDKNDDLIKQVFLTEGNIPAIYFSKEDLFLKGIKQDSKATIRGIILDSIVIYDFKTITEKWYFRGSGDTVIHEIHRFISPKHILKKQLYDFSRAFFTRSEISTFSNPKFEYTPPRTYYSKENGYDSSFTYKLNGISIEEYRSYFPEGNIRQKMYKTTGYEEDSIIVFRFDGSLKEKLYPYAEPVEGGEIKAKIIHKYDLNGTAIIEIDTIYQWFYAVSQKTNNSETTTFITEKNNKKLYSTIDTAFALGERDSLFIYQKHDLKILEGRFYYKNGQIKKRVFESEGDILPKYINQEDLFIRGNKPLDSIYHYARRLDSIIIYHSDGRMNKKWTKNEPRPYVNGSDDQYYFYAKTAFNANKLMTKPNFSAFIYPDIVSNKQRINENRTVAFELISLMEELVTFEIISKNNLQFQNGQNVVNYGDTLRLNLECNAAKSRNKYDFILRGTTADTTFNLNITLNIDGYHLTQSDFENGITYELATNNLVIYFENGGGKILKIYKNGVLEAEGSVPQIMNEISFKGYARGEYTLELLDLTTRRKDKMTLILK